MSKSSAEQPQVSIKISGLGITHRRLTLAVVQPVIDEIIEVFGIRRVMFASDFPVDRVHGSFDDTFSLFDQATRGCSADERAGLFAANAETVYRI